MPWTAAYEFAFASGGRGAKKTRGFFVRFAYPTTNSALLDPFDCREPGRCAVVVVSRLNPVRFDGSDIPSIAGVERRSQLCLTDGVRASIETIVTKAQHIQGSIVFGHR